MRYVPPVKKPDPTLLLSFTLPRQGSSIKARLNSSLDARCEIVRGGDTDVRATRLPRLKKALQQQPSSDAMHAGKLGIGWVEITMQAASNLSACRYAGHP